EQESTVQEQRFESHLRQLVQRRCCIVDVELIPVPAAFPQAVANPNIRVIKAELRNNPLGTFLTVVPQSIWKHIAEKTNECLASKKREGLYNQTSAAKFAKPVTPVDVAKAFGVRLAISGRLNFRTISKQFQNKPSGLSSWPFNAKRYATIIIIH
ncbi:MAG: hypothetical protein L0287_01055, partial [Anaerolineae bacterium]|nr:hypothetical protein [Anaerolineae bacterium]